MKEDIQQIIRTGNQEGLGRARAQTFLFLWAYGKNRIRKTQDELAAATGVNTRTLRAHLSSLDDEGWIKYSGFSGGNASETRKNIELKRFRH